MICFPYKKGKLGFWSYIDPGDSYCYLFCLFCSSPCLLSAPLTMQSSCCCFSPPAGYLPVLLSLCFLGSPAGSSILYYHQQPFPFTLLALEWAGKLLEENTKVLPLCFQLAFVASPGLLHLGRCCSWRKWMSIGRDSRVVHSYLFHCCHIGEKLLNPSKQLGRTMAAIEAVHTVHASISSCFPDGSCFLWACPSAADATLRCQGVF